MKDCEVGRSVWCPHPTISDSCINYEMGTRMRKLQEEWGRSSEPYEKQTLSVERYR